MCLGRTENQYHPSLYDLSIHNVHISAVLFIMTYVLILEVQITMLSIYADENLVIFLYIY